MGGRESFSLVSADAFGASSTYQLLLHIYARGQGVVTSVGPFGHPCCCAFCAFLPCHHRQCAIEAPLRSHLSKWSVLEKFIVEVTVLRHKGRMAWMDRPDWCWI